MADFDLASFLSAAEETSVPGLSLALLVGFLLSLCLRWHFLRFSSTFSNRREFSAIFPFLVLTVALVIAIVKSSLALSLGLVGALSIVRFRTLIKEPEELVYLFMAIAIGIGLGAAQILETFVATGVILTFTALVKLRHTTLSQNLFLSVTTDGPDSEIDLRALSDTISSAMDRCELRRVDLQTPSQQFVYFVAAKDISAVYQLLETLRAQYAGANISLIDQHRLPGV